MSSSDKGYRTQDVRNKARDVAQSTVATMQDVSSRAKDVAQSTASTVQDTVQAGMTGGQKLLLVGLDVTQTLLRRNFKRRNLKKQANKNLKKARKNLMRLQGSLQDNVQSGLLRTQDTVQTGLGVAQDVLNKNVKSANKSLKKAQKNMSRLQGKVQDNLQTGWGTAQDTMSKRTKSANKSLKKVSKNVKEVQDSLQGRIEQYQRKRARAKFLFRTGLLAGLVLILLYTPWPGSETRRRLGGFWQQFSQQAQDLLDRFSV